MRFALSREQLDFSRSIGALLAEADTPGVIRAWGSGKHETGLALWQRLADLGVTALAVPERHGGLGADAVDLVVALDALGYHAVPGPVTESVATVPALLGECGEIDQAASWLPALASGASIATLAASPEAPYALDADIADIRLCVSEGVLYEFDRPSDAPLSSVDVSRRLFAVDSLQRDEVAAVMLAIHRTLPVATLATAAQLLGAGRRLLEESVDYAKQRFQYGKAIGQYQAIKHMLADIATQLELARPLLFGAAVAIDAASPHASRDVSAARVATADAAYQAARAALQVHGAIGYTAEHDIGLWLTRVRALTSAWGTQATHRSRVLGELASSAGRAS
ncbi:hypothetical protein SAMN06265360_110176 [Haloechinothrix alba]|uniref:Acyl-CoA dehydrogenase n=1 Tax=Haloechinothrix alba TaxID=664784 RepID=A0A238XFR9_9PSEU|nr:acyl-CoA dehydrogenase family protein [Haloechinothrix alba]SNR57560.1 hypothetical protein SAMN06265360_110176 [Haloechinothrix alba]